MKTTINFDPNVVQGHKEFPPETIEFPLSKNQTKRPIELCTLKQELETDDDDATITKVLIGSVHTFH